ncbi:MAG: hypothetical protein ACTSR8_11825 [Promethearchaeota archaeon]
MLSKLSEYRLDKKAPNKNLPEVKKLFQEIQEIFEQKLSDTIPRQLIDDAKISLSKIEELLKLRTQNRSNIIFKLAQLANLILAQLKNEKNDLYLKVQITNFLLELKIAPIEMKNSAIPGLASGIIGIGLAAFPVWSYLAIIIGAYHLLQRDYRNQLIGIVVLSAVIVGLIVNFLLIQ